MTTLPPWQGVFPAVTTQFHVDGRLDIPATLRHIEVLLGAGVHGLIMLGTVGENCSLELPEKVELLQAVTSQLAGRVPVLTGVAEYTTSLAARFAHQAQEVGVDGLMVLPAMVYKSDARETLAHFKAVARATPLPIMCYNNPVSYGVDISPELFHELASETTIVAIKESSDDVRRVSDLVNLHGRRFLLFSGVDDLALESMMLGCVGWVSGLVNAFPAESMALWQLGQEGRFRDALPLYRWFMPLLHLDTHTKLVQYIKLTMAEVGLGSETTRPPRLAIEGAEREQILAIIRRAIANRPSLTHA